jgi:hypothetical protein
MSNRKRDFFAHAHDCTEQWENYVLCINRLGAATEELTNAFKNLAAARDALAQAVLEETEETKVAL